MEKNQIIEEIMGTVLQLPDILNKAGLESNPRTATALLVYAIGELEHHHGMSADTIRGMANLAIGQTGYVPNQSVSVN